MYMQDSGRVFRDFKVSINDIRYQAIEADDFEEYVDALNEFMEICTENNHKVLSVMTMDRNDTIDTYRALIEYTQEDNLYYEVERDNKDE